MYLFRVKTLGSAAPQRFSAFIMYFRRWLLVHYSLEYWKLCTEVCQLVTVLIIKVSKTSLFRRNVTVFPVTVNRNVAKSILLSQLLVGLPNLPKGNKLLE